MYLMIKVPAKLFSSYCMQVHSTTSAKSFKATAPLAKAAAVAHGRTVVTIGLFEAHRCEGYCSFKFHTDCSKWNTDQN